MIKSPLRYPGGKSRAVELISSIIPDFSEYREPFVGGGSVFVYLKQIYPNRKYWINDVYYELYKFWETTQNSIEQLIEQVNYWRNQFAEGKQLHCFLIENKENFNDIEIASAFFILNRITFSGTTESGGFSNQAFRQRFTESSIKRLKQLATMLSETRITNDDYQKVVEIAGENVFLFLDPPYYSATKSALYGKNGHLHKQFDHERFAKIMRNCNHKWLITYDDSEYIRNLFDFAQMMSFNLMYGMRNQTKNSDQTGKELFISNYPIKNNFHSITPRQPQLL
ncbi:MAG: modification methylase [Beggiatoa sp. IS2]|nr:MAG: modification methylase [Beggiatoa sp. IS2]